MSREARRSRRALAGALSVLASSCSGDGHSPLARAPAEQAPVAPAPAAPAPVAPAPAAPAPIAPASPPAPPPHTWDEMHHCVQDAECRMVASMCGGWEAIRDGEQAQLERYFEELAEFGGCGTGFEQTRHPRPRGVACVEQRCTLVLE